MLYGDPTPTPLAPAGSSAGDPQVTSTCALTTACAEGAPKRRRSLSVMTVRLLRGSISLLWPVADPLKMKAAAITSCDELRSQLTWDNVFEKQIVERALRRLCGKHRRSSGHSSKNPSCSCFNFLSLTDRFHPAWRGVPRQEPRQDLPRNRPRNPCVSRTPINVQLTKRRLWAPRGVGNCGVVFT